MPNSALLVTGASGQLGRRVVEILLERGAGPLIATTRTPDALAHLSARGVSVRAADFDEAAGLSAAFAGAERALLISTDALTRRGQRVEQHRAAIRAFEAAGVRHVVYTSLPNAPTSSSLIAPDHATTEALLEASSLGYTVLRNNLYADMLVGALSGALASGTLVHARGNGAAAYVTREDCAQVAAAALALRTEQARQTLDVSGPRAVTAVGLAVLASRLTGREFSVSEVAPEALVAALSAHGLPALVAALIASFDTAIARDELSHVTNTVERYTGKPARSLDDFLSQHAASLVKAASAAAPS